MITYSSNPFISYDAPDDKGVRAEVRVNTGVGKVVKIEKSKAGNSNKVSFGEFENNEYEVSGWTADEKLMKIIEAAKENDEPLHFRVEVKRKNNIDRKIPLAEVAPPKDMMAAKENIFKSLAAVKTMDGDWVISSYALTNMAEDPVVGMAKSANSLSIEELQKLSNNSSQNNSSNSSENRYDNSFVAASVPITVYNFIADYLKKNDIDSLDKEKALAAKVMVQACNEVQLIISDKKLEKPNLALNSHSRARQIIFTLTEHSYPLTKEIISDKNELEEWKKNIVKKAEGMWGWALKIVESV